MRSDDDDTRSPNNEFDFSRPGSQVIFGLDDKCKAAQSRVEYWTSKHVGMDVKIGLIGLIPLPGMGMAALTAATIAHGPLIHQPMARDLGSIYLADPDELQHVGSEIVTPGWIVNSGLDVGAYFGTAFLGEILPDILVELGIGAAASVVPIIGGIVSIGLDIAIARKMTTIIGRMVSMYYQNEARWLGSQRETYEAAKKMDGDYCDIRRNNAAIRASLLANVKAVVKMMIKDIPIDRIRELLLGRGVPADLIDDALATT